MDQTWRQSLEGKVDGAVLDRIQQLHCVLHGSTAQVSVQAEAALSEQQQAMLGAALRRSLPAGLTVVLTVRYAALKEQFCQNPQSLWPVLVRHLQAHHPAAGRMLTETNCRFSGNCLSLALPPLAHAYLTQHQHAATISAAVSTLFDLSCSVELLAAQAPQAQIGRESKTSTGEQKEAAPTKEQVSPPAQHNAPPDTSVSPAEPLGATDAAFPQAHATTPQDTALPQVYPAAPSWDAAPGEPPALWDTEALQDTQASPWDADLLQDPPPGILDGADALPDNQAVPWDDTLPQEGHPVPSDAGLLPDALPATGNDAPAADELPGPNAAPAQRDVAELPVPNADAAPPVAPARPGAELPASSASPQPAHELPAPNAEPAQPYAATPAPAATPPGVPFGPATPLDIPKLPDDSPTLWADPLEFYGTKSKKTKDQKPRRELETAVEGDRLFGRMPRGEVIPIAEVSEDSGYVTVRGRLVTHSARPLRNPRSEINNQLLLMDISDKSSSISVRAFVSQEVLDTLDKKAKNPLWLAIRGKVTMDAQRGELCLMYPDVAVVPSPPLRADRAGEKRVELHLHTKMSAEDGFVDITRLFALAKEMGHEALAITDHGVVQAFPEAYDAACKTGVQLVYGMEGYLTDDGKTNHHIVLLVKDKKGLNNLYRLVSAAHLHHFYRRPLIPRELLCQHREGLLLGSACEAGELFSALLHNDPQEKIDEIIDFYDFMEIQPDGNNAFLLRENHLPDLEALHAINRRILALADAAGKPTVATGDVHFLEPEDSQYREILMTTKGFPDAALQAPLFYRTTEEMMGEFAWLGADAHRVVVENPRTLAEQCQSFPPFPDADDRYKPEIAEADEALRVRAWDTCHARYGEQPPDLVRERLENELALIIDHRFGTLYWIAMQLVDRSNADGYVVGSRGSVGSSFAATMAGISEVNPLPAHYRCPACRHTDFAVDLLTHPTGPDLPEADCPHCGTPLLREGYDIPFEVFLGFGGEKVPDIDLNFSGDYQSTMHQYSQTLLAGFGGEVYKAGTIGTLASKTCYGYVKKYQDSRGIGYLPSAEINRMLSGMLGVKKSSGQHPGGMVVVPKGVDVYDFTPLQYPADDKTRGMITTHFDFNSMKERLIKIDILGHDYPTMFHMLQSLTGVSEVPDCHPAVMPLYLSTESLGVTPEQIGTPIGTLGLPEFGTQFVRGILAHTKPTTMDELIRIMGLSHGTAVWLGNAKDLIDSETATLRSCVCNRDDIFLFLRDKIPPLDAFFIMESVRKGYGLVLKKQGDMQPAMEAAGVPDWFIESCKKIQYMFPKAHATAYTIMANRLAYFKLFHPAAFYATVFTVRGDFDYFQAIVPVERLREQFTTPTFGAPQGEASATEEKEQVSLQIVLEMRSRGIELLPVDVYTSAAEAFGVEADGIRPPLTSLPGVGPSAAQSIVGAREAGRFISKQDMTERARVSKSVLELLEKAGCLTDMPQQNQLSLFDALE